MVFGRKHPAPEGDRNDARSALVEMLLNADEVERKRLLLIALQTGELKKSEVPELLGLVKRLDSVSGRQT